jgi:hypothetical protein
MWSNTQPHGGLIIVGVDDDGGIGGCVRLGTEHKNNIENLSHLCPDARWSCKEISVVNKAGKPDFVIAYRVTYRADKLVETSSGEAFIREGDKKLRLTEAIKREIRISKGEIHYELEPTALSYPRDFDLSEINKFCQAFFSNRRYQSAKGREELLELAKLGKRNGTNFIPNLACALLFANDPRDVIPGARIRIIRYEGPFEKFGGELNSVFSMFVDGNISKLLLSAKTIIASQLRSFQRYTSNGRIVSIQADREAGAAQPGAHPRHPRGGAGIAESDARCEPTGSKVSPNRSARPSSSIEARKSFVSGAVFKHISEETFLSLSFDEKSIINFLALRKEINITNAGLLIGKSWPTTSRIQKGLIVPSSRQPEWRHRSFRNATISSTVGHCPWRRMWPTR